MLFDAINRRKWLEPMLMADDGGEGGNGGDDGADDKPDGDDPKKDNPDDPPKNEPEKKYTDDDVDKLKKKWKAEKEKEIKEAEKLAEMNATEKAKYEKEKAEKELEELRKERALDEMAKEARSMMKEKNIAVGDDLLYKIIDEDAEKTKASVEEFVTLFTNEVDKRVKEEIKGETPPAGKGKPKPLTKEDISKIQDPAERQKKMAENMHLYD